MPGCVGESRLELPCLVGDCVGFGETAQVAKDARESAPGLDRQHRQDEALRRVPRLSALGLAFAGAPYGPQRLGGPDLRGDA